VKLGYVVLTLSLFAASLPTQAEVTGMGLQYGRPDGGPGLKDPTPKGVGRIQFSPHWGAEIAGVDSAAGLNGSDLATSYGYATRATSVMGIGTLPLTDSFSFYGKAGVVRGEDEGRFSFVGPAYGLDRTTDFTYGLGLKYDFSPTLGLRLEWLRFSPGGYLPGFGEGDVDLLSGGLRYQF
jgi:opacity protein-like surface antigen